jgi:glycosyltransferase involved in cell wall biosynthesis
MKILVFTTAYYPFVGGAEVAIKEITDRLTTWKPGFQVDMITARLDAKSPAFERIGNVNVYRLGFGFKHFDKWWLMKFGGWKAWSLHRKNKYDVSWSMMASWGGLAAWWFSVLSPKVPLVLTLQEGDEIGGRKLGLVSFGWRLILSKANIVTVISNYLSTEARKYGFKGEITLVPNGVDLDRFEVRGERLEVRKKIREELGLREMDTVLITASRLVEKNGVGDIIEALTFLPDNVKLLIAGSGSLEKELKLRTTDYGLGTRVIFLGYVDHARLPEYFAAADIFVRPSLSEGLGNAFLEAMAAGTPVIATLVGGIKDFLRNRDTGFVCQVSDPKSIAEQVRFIIDHPQVVEQVKITASKMVQEKYSWDNIARDMENVFRSTLGNPV